MKSMNATVIHAVRMTDQLLIVALSLKQCDGFAVQR
jgi:hypothetical protein